MKKFIRIFLKALAFTNAEHVLPTREKAMTSSIASMNQQHGTFAQRVDRELVSMPAPSSTNSAPASQDSARSFIAVLLRCLSAPNA